MGSAVRLPRFESQLLPLLTSCDPWQGASPCCASLSSFVKGDNRSFPKGGCKVGGSKTREACGIVLSPQEALWKPAVRCWVRGNKEHDLTLDKMVRKVTRSQKKGLAGREGAITKERTKALGLLVNQKEGGVARAEEGLR